MTRPTAPYAALMIICLALLLPAAPALADSDTHIHGEKAAREPYVPRGGAAVRTVGPDAACNFSNLQNAINASGDDDVLRVMSGTYSGGISITAKALSVIGGFPDCISTTPTGRSTLDQEGGGLVLDIFYPAAVGDPVRQVNIENMTVRNGGGTGFFSGGVVVEGRPGRLAVNFRNVQISDNNRTGTTDDGAGLRVLSSGDADGSGAFVTLDNDSIVSSNTTAGDGGGVHCRSTFDDGNVTMLRMGTTLVFDNEAENGGGVAVDGCQNVFLYNGGPVVLIFPAGGIIGNTANLGGGGLFLDDGAEVTMRAIEFNGFGDGSESALLAGNTANFGGGARVIGGSSLVLEDTYVDGNTGTLFNGGIGVGDESELTVRRNPANDECPDPVAGGGVLSRPPCSVIEDNSSQNVGGIGATTGALVDISRTVFRRNEASAGNGVSAIRATGVTTFRATDVRAEGVLIHDNIGDHAIEVQGVTSMSLLYSTVVDNSNDVALVTAPTGQRAILDVLSSILRAADGAAVLTHEGDGDQESIAGCVITNRNVADTDFDLDIDYSQINGALFRDPANDDFRLSFRSPAIDYCSAENSTQFAGLDGGARGVAWVGPQPDPNPAGASGDYDLGAFETAFELQNTDLAVASTASPAAFVGGAGESFTLELTLTNQGANTAFGDISVIDDFTAGAVVNQQWTCSPPAGVTCSPSSGSGDITTAISDLDPGQSVMFQVTANPANPGTDQEFEYIVIATESSFNLDTNPSNNEVLVEIRTGVFADGFESMP
ncbi:MAG TPA: hypothetical protein VKO85_07050 [Wenzhouxiangellaceae bacterium]|nr:hypothetical protein [Wenzhouxiangellaceae bacterium]